MQQLRDLHRLRNAAEEEQRRHQREREREAIKTTARNRGKEKFYSRLKQETDGFRDPCRCRGEATRERLESERRVKEHEERLRHKESTPCTTAEACTNGVMANAQGNRLVCNHNTITTRIIWHHSRRRHSRHRVRMCRRRAWEWCRRFWVLGHSRTSRRRRDRFVTRSNNNSNRLTNPFVSSFDRRIQQLLGATRKSKKNETKKKQYLENVRF